MRDTPLVVHITEAVQGGIIRHLDWIRSALPSRGVELHFILSLERTPGYAVVLDACRKEGIGSDVVPMQRTPSPVDDFPVLMKLIGCLRRCQPDLVHTHGSKGGFFGRLAATHLGIPALHTPHVFAFEWAHPGVKRHFYVEAERLAARWCRRLVLLSEAQRQAARDVGVGREKQYCVLPNGIDAGAYPPATPETRRAARERFGLPLDAPVLGMAARFEPQKGVGGFLRAARQVVDAVPEVRFLLAGEGAELAAAQDRARETGLAEHMIFCGSVEHILPFYHALDGFVLASLWEGLPYVILEAQAAGLPVVSTRTLGADAVIDDGVHGRLVPVGDSSRLAAAMLSLLNDPASARGLAGAGHRRVCSDFTLERWADGLAALYRDVLAES